MDDLTYTECSPGPSLRAVVRRLWALEGTAAPTGSIERIVPDGLPEIVLNCADSFWQIDEHGGRESQPLALVAGQMQRPLIVAPSGRIDLVGVRFQPTGLFALTGGLPASELCDQRVELAAIDPRLAQRLRAALVPALARDPRAASSARLTRLRRLEQALAEYHAERATTGDVCVHAALDLLQRAHGARSITQIAQALRVSARHLERGFAREVGLSPKTLARVLRFQRAFQWLAAPARRPAAEIALACGYYDQSHLIRDFRQFAGSTPLRGDVADLAFSRLFGGTTDESRPFAPTRS